MTRVALVASSFLPRAGGVEEHVRNVARHLRQTDEVVVWAVDQGDDGPAEVDGVRVRYLPTPMPAREPVALARLVVTGPRAAFAWWKALRHDRPDVLHVQCYGPNGPWATVLAAAAGRPLVVSSHGETTGTADRAFERSALLRRALRWSLSRAAAVTGCSASVLDDLRARFGLDPGRGEVVPNGVQLDEPAGTPPPGLPRRYLLAVGRLVETKGFDLLVDAFARAHLPPDVHLVIAGDGPELDRLRALAGTVGVGDRVTFPGRLTRGEVVAVTAGALALVVPSRVEAFGIVVLEGWRAGVPVVATSYGGPGMLVEDDVTGLVADPQDADAFARALERATGPDGPRLGAAGRRVVTDYTWERVVDDYRKIYLRLR